MLPTLDFKFKGNVTRSPTQEVSMANKKDFCPPKILKNEQMNQSFVIYITKKEGEMNFVS